jgi:hypothetical protein
MLPANGRPETLSELIDRLEAVREELLKLQRALEKVESGLAVQTEVKIARIKWRFIL